MNRNFWIGILRINLGSLVKRLSILGGILLLIGCQVNEPKSEAVLTPTFLPNNSIENPIPEFLGFVVPSSGEILTLEQYNDIAPLLGWGVSDPGICFSIGPGVLAEAGDFYYQEEDWAKKVSLFVNGELKNERPFIYHTDMPDVSQSDSTTGEIIWNVPFDFGICYKVELSPGHHVARILVTKSSGEESEYLWTFLITE